VRHEMKWRLGLAGHMAECAMARLHALACLEPASSQQSCRKFKKAFSNLYSTLLPSPTRWPLPRE